MPVDIEAITETLARLANSGQARKNTKHVQTLRGVRGVADGDVARCLADTWKREKPAFPDDVTDLRQLFFGAHEDGLISIGLLAAILPDDPEEALEIGLDLLESVDDVQTADALGWLVLGPGILTAGRQPRSLINLVGTLRRDAQRRAVVMSAMAWLPEPLEGPAAAALRERLGQRTIAFVEEAQSDAVRAMIEATFRDQGTSVRKAVRRLLRCWGSADPEAVLEWADSVRGGLPKMFKSEVSRAKRRAEAQA
ncbi:MAG: DNA alkylation repair protein [Proteobacteria bacterium]|nr:DNA alkylation repair protein [Pseudomonadota bacterium]